MIDRLRSNAVRVLLLAVPLALAGCVQTSQQKQDVVTQFFKGMNRNSYGTLIPVKITAGQALAACSGGDVMSAELAHKITEGLVGDLFYSSQNMLDETAVMNDLDKHFRRPKGMHLPSVRVLALSANGIDFWYQPASVQIEETEAAARDWCQRQGRTVAFDGAAVGCRAPIQFGGQTIGREYFAIAAYRCLPAGREAAKVSRKKTASKAE